MEGRREPRFVERPVKHSFPDPASISRDQSCTLEQHPCITASLPSRSDDRLASTDGLMSLCRPQSHSTRVIACFTAMLFGNSAWRLTSVATYGYFHYLATQSASSVGPHGETCRNALRVIKSGYRRCPQNRRSWFTDIHRLGGSPRLG